MMANEEAWSLVFWLRGLEEQAWSLGLWLRSSDEETLGEGASPLLGLALVLDLGEELFGLL